MKKNVLILSFGLLFIGASSTALAQEKTTEQVLEAFVESYRSDPMALNATFGIQVGEEAWYVVVHRHQEAYAAGKEDQYTLHRTGPHEVTLNRGMPNQPTWYFKFADRETLDKIDQKVWTATTAAQKSTAADVVALNILDMEGFTSGQGATATAYTTLEHFWKRDAVEVTRFSRDASLPSHGAAMVGLYTMKDKRLGWFSLGTDEEANADRGLDRGQVPNLFIITKGKGKAILGDQEMDLEPGMSVFVPAYMKHVFWNPNEEPLEGIIVLFGDNIDYVFGDSYIDFVEAEYEYYDEHAKRVEEM